MTTASGDYSIKLNGSAVAGCSSISDTSNPTAAVSITSGSVSTTFQPGTDSGVTFEGASGATSTLDLSGESAAFTVAVNGDSTSSLGRATSSSITDSFAGVQSFVGSAAGGNTFIDSAAGGHSFSGDGSLGNTLDLSAARVGLTVNANLGTATGPSFSDTFSAIQSFVGSAAGGNRLIAKPGGGATLDGGSGSGNTVDFSDFTDPVKIDLFGGTETDLSSGQTDMIKHFQNAIAGSANNNTIVARPGGGATLDGGSGTGNTVDFSAFPAGVTVDLNAGTEAGGAGQSDTLRGMESVIGSAAGGNRFIAPGAGGYSFAGQGQGNTLDLSLAPSGTTVDLQSGKVQNLSAGVGGSTIDTFSDIQNFTGAFTFSSPPAPPPALPSPPSPPPGTTSSASCTSSSAAGTCSATNENATAIGSGEGSITVSQYPADPVGSPTFSSAGEYFDVQVATGSSFSSLELVDCNLNAGTSLDWWDGSAWQAVSPQSYSPGPPACATAILEPDSSPTIAPLTGTVFAVALSSTSTGEGTVVLGRARVIGAAVRLPVNCRGGLGVSCKVTVELSVTETLKGGKLIAVTAANKRRKTGKKTVAVGTTTVTLTVDHRQIIHIALNTAGRRLLARYHTLKVELAVIQSDTTIARRTLTFKIQPRNHQK